MNKKKMLITRSDGQDNLIKFQTTVKNNFTDLEQYVDFFF